MKKNRSELRYIVMEILYQKSVYEKNKVDFNLDNLIKKNLEIDNEYVKDMIYGIITYKDELEKVLNKHLKDWNLSRLSYLDQVIFLIGAYEILKTETPGVVCINEAIELSKKFSDVKVTNMLNATLDKIYKEKNE